MLIPTTDYPQTAGPSAGRKTAGDHRKHHNFAWKEKLADGEELIIHRKGATPTRVGDVGIIPGTMASPAYIVVGKGNEESLQSAAHGAGRLVSRRLAKNHIPTSSCENTATTGCRIDWRRNRRVAVCV
jgi:tRNA-splicing ligase RtcB